MAHAHDRFAHCAHGVGRRPCRRRAVLGAVERVGCRVTVEYLPYAVPFSFLNLQFEFTILIF
jgi:hypothetical protein